MDKNDFTGRGRPGLIAIFGLAGGGTFFESVVVFA